jgi:deazaflavin-dependent oxidoreductase (nitroreductase family)
MTSPTDFNAAIIDEFRANAGKVGGSFDGAPIVLIHHVGRKTGNEHLTPMVYQQATNPAEIYVFASKAGAPTNPDWYYNLTAAGTGTVEVGTETYPVTVSEVTGAKRDEIYAAQVAAMPGFGEYEEKTAGIRTIPVLALQRT